MRHRILARGEAEAATQNTVLDPATRAELAEYGDRSVDFAMLLERLALGDFALATDDATPREVAAEAIRRYRAADSTAPTTT